MIGHSSDVFMWVEEDNKLKATFRLQDFVEAFAFMTEIAIHSEKQNHHPKMINEYNAVQIELSTHDAGNIVTEKDRKLADAITASFKKYNR
jgi:4a-hydroxytetrahydrobiopterin dehydratase